MKSKEDAKRNQERIAKYYNLGWWYGTRCEKCCEAYPKLIVPDQTTGRCYYECEACGKKTKTHEMPWQAEEAWNRHEYKDDYVQLKLF